MSLAIPKGSLVLVTGATGYIGSWITHEFVKQGYRVRVAARNQEKANLLKEVIEKEYGTGKIEIALIADMADPKAYDEAIKGVAAVNHVASDATFDSDANAVINSVVTATKALLQLSAKETSVKRFVLTSSSVAISLPVFGQDFTFGPDVWNDYVTENVWKADPSSPETGFLVYSASKTFGEKAVWEFITEEKPHFAINTVLPNYTMGPALHDKLRGSTHTWLRGLFNGDETITALMKGAMSQQWWVNVEDIARLHVGATIFEDVQGKRLLGFTDKYNLNQFLDTMHEIDPQRKLTDKIELKEDLSKAETEESLKVLKKLGRDGWAGYDETMRANLE